MADAETLTSIQVIDTDSHVSEPYDLWTSRVSHRSTGTASRWSRLTSEPGASTGLSATPGWRPPASSPKRVLRTSRRPAMTRNLEDADPGSWDPADRLKRMDEYGIHAQVLYPNLIGFESPLFMELGDEVSLAAPRSTTTSSPSSPAPIPTASSRSPMVPFWDIEAPR